MPYKPTGRNPGRPKKPASVSVRGNVRPNLTPNQWRAIRAELNLLGGRDLDRWPLHVSLNAVAVRAGVSKNAVWKWRKMDSYRDGLKWLFLRDVVAGVRQELRRDTISHARKLSKEEREFEIWEHVSLHWPQEGEVVSPYDDKVYNSVDAYVRHLMEWNLTPYRGRRDFG